MVVQVLGDGSADNVDFILDIFYLLMNQSTKVML